MSKELIIAIIDMLESTLGSMPPEDADRIVKPAVALLKEASGVL